VSSVPQSYLPLLDDAAAALQAAFEDEEVLTTIELRDEWSMLSARLPELAVEQIQAIGVLCDAELWRPAYAVLRGLLECMATILWIAHGPADAPRRFAGGHGLKSRKLLAAVGWQDEYDMTFRYLSEMAHPSADAAEAYRWYDDSRSIHAPAPEITPDLELYVVGLPGEDAVAVPVRGQTPEQIRAEFEPFVVAKAFDLVTSALAAIYGGDRCWHAAWWPERGFDLLAICLREHPSIRGRLRWRRVEASPSRAQLDLREG
jgi:hypothetical protein